MIPGPNNEVRTEVDAAPEPPKQLDPTPDQELDVLVSLHQSAHASGVALWANTPVPDDEKEALREANHVFERFKEAIALRLKDNVEIGPIFKSFKYPQLSAISEDGSASILIGVRDVHKNKWVRLPRSFSHPEEQDQAQPWRDHHAPNIPNEQKRTLVAPDSDIGYEDIRFRDHPFAYELNPEYGESQTLLGYNIAELFVPKSWEEEVKEFEAEVNAFNNRITNRNTPSEVDALKLRVPKHKPDNESNQPPWSIKDLSQEFRSDIWKMVKHENLQHSNKKVLREGDPPPITGFRIQEDRTVRVTFMPDPENWFETEELTITLDPSGKPRATWSK